MTTANTTTELFDLPTQHRGVTWDVFHAAGGRVEILRNDDAERPVFRDDSQAAAYVFSIANCGGTHPPDPDHRAACRQAVREVVRSWDTTSHREPYYAPGHELDNNAVVLLSKRVSTHYDVLLCEVPENAKISERYVVWFCLHGPHGGPSCGDFYMRDQLQEALRSYESRRDPPRRTYLADFASGN